MKIYVVRILADPEERPRVASVEWRRGKQVYRVLCTESCNTWECFEIEDIEVLAEVIKTWKS